MRLNNRRDFMKTGLALGTAFWVARGAKAESPNESVYFASIGVGGKGDSDTSDAARLGRMVALCDVDLNTLGAKADSLAEKHPDIQRFQDFRELFDKVADKIDAVTVSTPDHTHAPAAALAMRLGKHCFCQKPMTHSIAEARLLGQLASEKGLKTQMGNQGTATDKLRRSAALLRKGILGTVKEVHIWTNRPIWPQGCPRPEPTAEGVPENLDWKLWLGPAPFRPYVAGAYHSFKWRGWWDFGTGALGDMACHTVNMPYMGLDIADPKWVQAETSGHNRDSYPNWSVIECEFPKNDWRDGFQFFWYDGGKKVDRKLVVDCLEDEEKDGKTRKAQVSASGILVIGEKDTMYAPGDYAENGFRLASGETKWDDFAEFEKSPGHFEEFVEAIQGKREQAVSNFPKYAGPLTETILLGNLAVYAAPEEGKKGRKVEWDAKDLKVLNDEDDGSLSKIVHKEYPEDFNPFTIGT